MVVNASAPASPGVKTEDDTIRPFSVDFPEEDVKDLRGRIAAPRWPSKELVDDGSQGVQLATLRELTRYWATDYDFRRLETRLNALPQFKTRIDGLDIHFIHVKSKHENALPLLITHGWPSTCCEALSCWSTPNSSPAPCVPSSGHSASSGARGQGCR